MMKTHFIIILLWVIAISFACDTKNRQSEEEMEIVRDTVPNTQDLCIDCIINETPIIVQPIWIDSMKTQLRLDITYTNLDSLPHIIWLGAWVVAVLDNNDAKNWFSQSNSYYNKLYITKAKEKTNFQHNGDYHACYRVPRGFLLEDICFENYKVLHSGECFKVSIAVDDAKIIEFVKKHSFRITLVFRDPVVKNEDMYASNVQLLSKENKKWYNKNCLSFKLDYLCECCDLKKIYYRDFVINQKYRTPILLNDIFDEQSQIINLGAFRRLKLSQIPKKKNTKN